MSSLSNWVKEHIAASILIVIAIYFVYNFFVSTFFGIDLLNVSVPESQKAMDSSVPMGAPSGLGSSGRTSFPAPEEFAPQPDVDDRMVIQESNISLLVEDVNTTQDRILNFTRENDGYMVNTSLSNPEDAPTSTITIRVPSDKLNATLDFLESQAVKVVSENLTGRDVTDQYVDIEERLHTLENTKARLETILEQAEEIQDISNVTQQVINYQRQIDSLRGQQQALEQNAEMARLTIYLSTDEYALPYTPSETWRPEVVFKNSVRSLISTLREIGSLLIVVAVYSVIWLPALIIYILVKRYLKKRRRGQEVKHQ